MWLHPHHSFFIWPNNFSYFFFFFFLSLWFTYSFLYNLIALFHVCYVWLWHRYKRECGITKGCLILPYSQPSKISWHHFSPLFASQWWVPSMVDHNRTYLSMEGSESPDTFLSWHCHDLWGGPEMELDVSCLCVSQANVLTCTWGAESLITILFPLLFCSEIPF